MDQSEDDGQPSGSLQAIASALELPLETFFREREENQSAPTASEVSELLALFQQIPNAQRRCQCLDLVRELARQTDEESL